tara:strand:- start:730 stop:1497 length:768 start_codon:yes stop_codon:yes gene_type:complete
MGDPSSPLPRFLFIPGGGMSSWVWRYLDNDLGSNGILIDQRIPANTKEARRTVGLADCVRHIEECVGDIDESRIVVVAHSGGGVLAPIVAGRMSERVDGIIFVAANIPEHGHNATDALPFPIRILNRVAARVQVRSDSIPMRKYETMIRKSFCNTCTEQAIQYVLNQTLQSEPLCLLNERVDWAQVPATVRMAYIRLTKDKTASVALQDRMAGNLAIREVHEIESDHMVMISHPDSFNRTIKTIVRGWAAHVRQR